MSIYISPGRYIAELLFLLAIGDSTPLVLTVEGAEELEIAISDRSIKTLGTRTGDDDVPTLTETGLSIVSFTLEWHPAVQALMRRMGGNTSSLVKTG